MAKDADFFNLMIKNEFGFLDAPVSGGQAGAENGALTVMEEPSI